MENKAHYTLIGAFIIALLISLFVFLIWLAKFDIDQKYNEYDIYFSESVAGLTEASHVSYNGIPVGEVRDISIAPNDPSKVLVTIRIKEETPVLVDTMTTLGMQGITGVLFVQIIGGQPGSPDLEAKPGEERPVINSRPSTLEEFFGGSGELIRSALETLERVNRIMDDENIARISVMLDNFEGLSSDIAAEGETIRTMLVDLKDAVGEAEKLFKDDLRPVAGEFLTLTQTATSLVTRLDTFIAENTSGITEFSQQGLPEMKLLFSDLRALSQTLDELTNRLAERPSEIIFKTKDPEYEVDK
ncbi:MAG: MlaD family protein [Sphingomonadales bacterium]